LLITTIQATASIEQTMTGCRRLNKPPPVN
jgi:hypothetical protein